MPSDGPRTDPSQLVELRRICLALPEVEERRSHGAPTWFIRGKRTLAHFWDGHHDDERIAMWCPAPAGVQEQMVDAEPDRFFRPPYVGGRGWLGVRLDHEPDWDEVAGIVEEAYRHVAPKTLVKMLTPPGEG